jgi:hypothetical protein
MAGAPQKERINHMTGCHMANNIYEQEEVLIVCFVGENCSCPAATLLGIVHIRGSQLPEHQTPQKPENQ